MTAQEEKKIRNLIEYVLRNKAEDSSSYDLYIVKKDEKELDFKEKDIFSLSEFVMDTVRFHEPIKKIMFVFSNGNTHSVSFDKEKEVLLVGGGGSGLMGANTADIDNLISDKATELFLKFKTENDLAEAKKSLADAKEQLSRALSDNSDLKDRIQKLEAQHEKAIKKLTDEYEQEIDDLEAEYEQEIEDLRKDINLTENIKQVGLGLIEKIPSDTFDTLIRKSPVIQRGLGITPADLEEQPSAIQTCSHADLSKPDANVKPYLHKIYNHLCKLSPKDFGKVFNLLSRIFKSNIPIEQILNFITHQSESHDNKDNSNSNE